MSDLLVPDLVLPPLGLTFDLDNELYHRCPGVSNTGLSVMARSMAHYYARYLDPRRPPEPERAGQLEGTLAHCAILEPAAFDTRYIVEPADAPRRPSITQLNAKNPSKDTLAAIAYWQEFDATHAGKRAITNAQRDAALYQGDSVRRLPEVRKTLECGWPEVSAFWEDPVTGELCRCRPDWTHPVGETAAILLDVKTYSDASKREFIRQIGRKGYHRQDAHYSDGFALASELDVLAFFFVAVETDWPYAACAHMLNEPSKEAGRREVRALLNHYHACRRTGLWPGYSDGIEVVGLPDYMTRES